MEIVIILILILLNGLFAMSEVALISARKSNLAMDAKKGSIHAKTALKLIEQPDRFLSTVQIGITLIGILTGLYSGATIADDFSAVLEKWGMSPFYAHPVAQTIIVLLVTFVSIVFGELVPKRIGMSAAEKIGKTVSSPMFFLSSIAAPFVWILSKTTSTIIRILGLKNKDSKITEEEIKSMIAEGTKDGEVQEMEQDIVERVFSLGDRKIESIMTIRNDIVWIDQKLTNEEIFKIIQNNLYDVYPVGNGSLDKITGVVFLKDLFGKLQDAQFKISDEIRPAQYFHENMDVYKVLQQMREHQLKYGLICDEFGVFQGMVTHKDMLEGLIGSIIDQEDEPDIIVRQDGESWFVDGQTSFYDFLSHFEMEDLYNECGFNTVGGLILELLEHIPRSGEKIIWNCFVFEIVDMDGARIDKILVIQNRTQQVSEF